MNKLFPYIAFACLTGFTATSGLPLMAGGCSNQINKKVEIKCTQDDTKCQAEKFETNETIRS